jgi:ATP-dependent helicase/nuclease subunit A
MSESHHYQPQDFEVRVRALDTGKSFAVAAPAGSGKTGLLTLRLLKLLCLVEKPEHIVCITFTRKAAAEMRERLLAALTKAHEPLSDGASEHEQMTQEFARQVLERDAELEWHLQTAPGRLRIQTIDSFCRSLASQLPIASALGAELATLDDPNQAYRLAVQQLLDGYANGAPGGEDLEILIRHLDNQLNRLEGLLVSLLAKRDQWMALLFALKYGEREQLEAGLRLWAEELIEDITEGLAPFAGELFDSIRYATTNLADENPDHELMALRELAFLPGDSDLDIQHYWHPLANLLLTNDDNWRKQVNKNQGFPAGKTKEEKALAQAHKQKFLDLLGELKTVPCLLENLEELRRFPGSRYTEEEWTLLSSLTHVLPRLVAELKLVFRKLGATDFVEVTEAALNALGSVDEPSELALKLDYQIQHILVDEFQDTASPQLSLLEKLTEGWQQGDGRTLFVVGDGMQSCYGFRDANVGIFLDLRSHGLPAVSLEALDLTVNFRSRAGIVDWVNQVFDGAFPDADDIGRGAVRYSPSYASDTRPPENCVTCVGFTEQEDHLQEAKFVAQQIKQLREAAPEDSIAILVRGRAHLREIVPALSEVDIPYKAVDIDPLLSRMAIIDLLSLTRALLDPSDRIAWLSVLRAPWCGLSMSDLHALVNTDIGERNNAPRDQGFASIPGQIAQFEAITILSPAGVAALKRLRDQLFLGWAHRRRKPLRQWVEGIWVAIGGPTTAATRSEQEDAQAFFRVLERHEQAGTIANWQEFEDALARLFAQPAVTQDNPVELMTIHKSKGLEFDHVFLPGLDRRTRPDDPPLIVWHQYLSSQGDNHLILSPITAAEEESPSPLFTFLTREKRIKDRLEETRLLYVACTRAKQRLWLTANLQLDKKGELKAPSDNCLLARIWPQIEQQVLREQPFDTREPLLPDSQPARSFLKRLVPDWQRPEPDFSHPLGEWRLPNQDSSSGVAADHPFANRTARHRGTFWHRVLRRLALDGLQQWNAERLARQQQFWLAQARQLGLVDAEAQALVKAVVQSVAQLRANQQALWIFDNSHPESQCEYAVVSQGGRQKLIVDRTFIHEGTRWIIDFKTSEPETGQSLAAFLKQEREAYRPQLESYANAFARMEDLPQSLALYFPALQHLEVL